MRAVPGNLVEVNAVEEERYLAVALFGLAGSPTGRGIILSHPATIRGKAATAAKSSHKMLIGHWQRAVSCWLWPASRWAAL
jgi:hypothetical protein